MKSSGLHTNARTHLRQSSHHDDENQPGESVSPDERIGAAGVRHPVAPVNPRTRPLHRRPLASLRPSSPLLPCTPRRRASLLQRMAREGVEMLLQQTYSVCVCVCEKYYKGDRQTLVCKAVYSIDHVAHHDDQLPLVSVPDATTATQFGDEAESNRQTRRGTIRVTHIPGRNTECTVCFVSI